MAANPTDIRELDGYEEMRRKLVESLSLEERLAVVAGLGPAERLAAIEQIVDTLPADLRAALLRRLGGD